MNEFWRRVLIIIFGLAFFVIFSAAYGVLVYTRPQKVTSNITPQDFGFEYEDIRLTTGDGWKLSAWFVPAARPIQKAIILLHGYPADKGDILPATIFLVLNYNLLYLDFRYFGQSEGKYSTVGIKEVQDVLAALKYLKSRGQEKIGIWGFSMGAATALMSLPKSSEINAIVSESSYTDLKLMAEEVYRQVPPLNKIIARIMLWLARVLLDADASRNSPIRAVANSQIPSLFIHAEDDQVIPFAHARLLQEAVKDNPKAEFWFRESSAHGDLGSGEYQQKIQDFFARNL